MKKSMTEVSVEEIEKYIKNLKGNFKILTTIQHHYVEINLTDEHGVRYPERIMNSNKSATSIMFAANAVGFVMPPYVV